MTGEVKVSVIVPIYNVEEYLRECLDSLLNQTLKEIEVIMVDDGSTDSSAVVAKEYEDKYENFKLVSKVNGGLGQARNWGVPYATGEYIAFVDSDDYLPVFAYEKIYLLAKKNDSDLAIGNVKRFDSKREYESALHKKVFVKTMGNTHISKMPELIYDATAWNKLFKRTFWQENNFSFPEGVLYEDVLLSTKAHYLSKSTALLVDVIYYWRQREGNNKSITQQRTDINNFLDKIKALNSIIKYYKDANISEDELNFQYHKWVSMDLITYINKLDDVDEEYLSQCIKEMQKFIAPVGETVFTKLKAINRIKYYLIKNNKVEQLKEVLYFEKNNIKTLKVVNKGACFQGEFPFEGIPKELFDMTYEIQETKVKSKIENMSWNNNKLIIDGFAYTPRVSQKKQGDVNISAVLKNEKNKKQTPIDIKLVRKNEITDKYGVKAEGGILSYRLYNYDWSGYKIIIDFNSSKVVKLGEGNLKIVVKLKVGGLLKEFYLNGPVGGKKARPLPILINNQRLRVNYNKVWDLEIATNHEQAGITKMYIEKGRLKLEGWMNKGVDVSKFFIANWKEEEKVFLKIKVNANSSAEPRVKEKLKRFTTSIKVSDLSKFEGNQEWFLHYFKKGVRYPLTGANCFVSDIYYTSDKQMLFGKTKQGTISINFRDSRTYLSSVKFEGTKMKVIAEIGNDFFAVNQSLSSIRLRSQAEKSARVIFTDCAKVEKFKNKTKLTFLIELTEAEESKFSQDKWLNYVEYSFENTTVKHSLKIANEKKFKKLKTKTHKYIPYLTQGNNLGLEVELVWGLIEKSPRRREYIQKLLYPMFRWLPVKKNRVVFESYWSDKYSCNPRYLYEYINKNHPEYDCILSLRDDSIKVNGQGKKIRRESLKYFYYMATSKFFVNNVNFPDFIVKRKEAVEIQTMHGTPLKTLGIDVPGDFPTDKDMDLFLQRCGRWDYIVTQSDTVEKITKHCYQYNKKYLKVGYPRNDVLINNNTPEYISQIKDNLNIPKDKKVILYAPTWRVKNKFEMMLDVEKLRQELGDEYVILLRAHHLAAKGMNSSIFNDLVRDVTYFESIEELYLIADMLITDYSSVMFDYAVLERPMLFFTYDLESYKNNLRGFNIDLEEEAPGPLVFNSDEIIHNIKNMDVVFKKYSNKFKIFKDKFCQYENGNAAKSIFNKVFNAAE